MSNRSLDSVAFTLAVVLLAPAPVAGQSRLAAAKKWTAPLTPDGQPDLQGIWTNATIAPLERPKELAGKEFFTEQEAVEYEKRIVQNSNRDRRSRDAEADLGGAYNELWFDRAKVAATRRTSLVADLSDGKIPPLTPEAQKAAAARAVIAKRSPEGPALPVRCIVWPTSGRPHIAKNIRQWLGNSRGHWDGKTLVVDTTNFTGGKHFMGSDQNLHLVEREHDSLPVHLRRSDCVYKTVEGGRSPDEGSGTDIRVRVPRGELLDGRHARWNSCPRESSRGS